MTYVEIFGLLLFIVFTFHLIKRPRIGANEPPLVPYRYPIIGHTYDFYRNSANFLQNCKEKYGEPFSLYILGSVRTYTGDETSYEVFRNSDIFDNSATLKVFPIVEIFDQFRQFNSPEFRTRVVHEQISGKVNIYTSRMQKEFLSGIEKYFGDCKEPKVFRNIRNTLGLMVAKPVANVILCEEAAQFEDIITSFVMLERELTYMRLVPPILSFISPSLHTKLLKLPLKFGWNPISQHRDIFVKRCKPIVEERLRQRKELGEKYIPKEDLLDFYLNDPNFKTDVADDKYMNDLFGQLYEIVFASVSTTSRSLSFALFDYAGRPELWDEIYKEQLKIHNESNGILTTDDIQKMVKLDCFLKESFRYSSDIVHLIVHTMTKDSYTFSNGTTIPKGRDVYIFAKDTAFSSKFYGDTVHDFQPKRHITSNSNGEVVHSPATKVDRSLLTFGGGKHACPGRVFAVNEIKMCLHKLILRYHIRTESGKVDPTIMKATVVLPPASGLVLKNRN
ncbi:cytochrome P450 [Gigaspora rosea]|uniref:Cytochrome P450 n=1 Tax=Gigaspora rosea TaxID=44941 RepID=A0A397VZT2_9GLOM|nr:cytochrome P450 [Gigaspora rosea]